MHKEDEGADKSRQRPPAPAPLRLWVLLTSPKQVSCTLPSQGAIVQHKCTQVNLCPKRLSCHIGQQGRPSDKARSDHIETKPSFWSQTQTSDGDAGISNAIILLMRGKASTSLTSKPQLTAANTSRNRAKQGPAGEQFDVVRLDASQSQVIATPSSQHKVDGAVGQQQRRHRAAVPRSPLVTCVLVRFYESGNKECVCCVS